MRLGAMLGLLVLLGAAALVGCSQSETPPPDSAGMPDAGDGGLDAGDAAEIPDCSYPCMGDGFVGAC